MCHDQSPLKILEISLTISNIFWLLSSLSSSRSGSLSKNSWSFFWLDLRCIKNLLLSSGDSEPCLALFGTLGVDSLPFALFLAGVDFLKKKDLASATKASSSSLSLFFPSTSDVAGLDCFEVSWVWVDVEGDWSSGNDSAVRSVLTVGSSGLSRSPDSTTWRGAMFGLQPRTSLSSSK